MAKPSQLDRALTVIDDKLEAHEAEHERAMAKYTSGLEMLKDMRDVLLATKQATAKIKGASKRKASE